MANSETEILVMQQSVYEPWREHKVPLYPLDPTCNGMTVFVDKTTYLQIQRCVGDPTDTIIGVRSANVNWKPDLAGIAKLRAVIRELLIEKGFHKEEELRHWTIQEILPPLFSAVYERNERLSKRWREALFEAYEMGLRYQSTWQQKARELIALVQEYNKALERGEFPPRTAIPHVFDEPEGSNIFRLPDSQDTSWFFFTVGWKLEGLFGVKGTFIPADIHLHLHEDSCSGRDTLMPTLACSIFDQVNGGGSIDDFKTWWLHVKLALLAEGSEDPVHTKRKSPTSRMPGNNAKKKRLKTPADLISFANVISRYHVSRSTLQRAIRDGELISYRTNPKGHHRVSEKDVKAIYQSRG
jgi:hypothetical protein